MAMINIHTFTSDDAGFSLVELITVIAIISILVSIATFAFHDWMVKSRVEAQVRDMAADINNLRVRALTTKQRHSILINPGSYIFRSYTSEDQLIEDGEYVVGGIHRVAYNLKKNSTNMYAGEVYEIDSRGILEIDSVMYPDNVIPVLVEYNGNASIDCLNIYAVRINTGKWNSSGDKCDDK